MLFITSNTGLYHIAVIGMIFIINYRNINLCSFPCLFCTMVKSSLY